MAYNPTFPHLFGGALAAAFGLAALGGPAAAQVDFAGQRIEAIVPFSEGGGGDSYTRYMAAKLAPHLAGEPSIVIRNMPGGGSVVGANYFDANAKTDGTNFAVASTSTTLTYALRPDDPSITFEPSEWIAFVASPVGRVLYIDAKLGVKTVADLKSLGDRELRIATSSPTGSDMPNLLSLELLGLNMAPVFGMDGGDAHMAMERGELDFNGDTIPAFLQSTMPRVEAGEVIPLFTFGIQQADGTIGRDPSLPDLPTFIEAYTEIHGKEPSGPAFDAWMSMFQMAVMSSKALVLPAGTPEDVVATYDAAVTALLADPAFKEEAKAFIGDYDQLSGDAARKSLVAATTISDEARAWVLDWLKNEHNAEM